MDKQIGGRYAPDKVPDELLITIFMQQLNSERTAGFPSWKGQEIYELMVKHKLITRRTRSVYVDIEKRRYDWNRVVIRNYSGEVLLIFNYNDTQRKSLFDGEKWRDDNNLFTS